MCFLSVLHQACETTRSNEPSFLFRTCTARIFGRSLESSLTLKVVRPQAGSLPFLSIGFPKSPKHQRNPEECDHLTVPKSCILIMFFLTKRQNTQAAVHVQTLPGCSFFAIVAKLSEFVYLLPRHIEKKLCTDAVVLLVCYMNMAICAFFIQ